MTSQVPKLMPFTQKGGEMLISGAAFVELLRGVLDKKVPFRFQARGSSMIPFIKDGDVVTLAPLTCASLRVGDVAAFISPGSEKLMVHRIIGKWENSFLIQGDNISEPDGSVPKANVLARVSKVERNKRNVILGIGPERILIAFLVRRRLLISLMSALRSVLRFPISIIRRWVA